ncbi:MAG: hypothetical protein ACOCPN_00845 [Desulfonatronovibrionaceae bacterium]
MDNWVSIAVFEKMDQAVEKERRRIEDMALDVGLMPEKVIRVEEKDKVEILIHPEFYSYYEG